MVQVTPVDTAGQSTLDSTDRTFIVSSSGIAPSVAITSPAVMNPPTSAQPLTVTPGSPMTFSGTANDDKNLDSVAIQLRNSTTRENLASDGTWGTDVQAGWFRISPANLNAASYNWSYTTPFTLKPGAYSFSVMATDDEGLTTSSTNQGRLSITAQVAGDAPPNGLLDVTGTVNGLQSLHLDLAGTATDDVGVARVEVGFLRAEQQPLPPAERLAGVELRHPDRDAGHPERHQHHVDLADRPAGAGRLEPHGVRVRHGRPAGPLDDRGDRAVPDLPG